MTHTLALIMGALLIFLGCALLVGAARNKVADMSGRVRAMVVGITLFATGLLVQLFAFPGTGLNAALPATVLGAAALGSLAGYWHGHTSGRRVS